MKHNKFFSFKTLSAALLFTGVTAVGCHVDDTNPAPAESDTTSMMSSADHMSSDHTGADAKSSDHSMMSTATTVDTTVSMTAAKPDPAKKGMKGKVIVMESPKMTGSMEADKSGTYSNVEVYPSFPGGNGGLQKYFDNNLKYPENASNDGVEGTVQVMFTVDENGKLSNPHIMGEKPGYGLEDEALRVVKTMPAWNPGKLKGKNVKTNFTLPVKFQLY